MPIRIYLAGLLTLSLSACAWLPWHHRAQAPPGARPETRAAPAVPHAPAKAPPRPRPVDRAAAARPPAPAAPTTPAVPPAPQAHVRTAPDQAASAGGLELQGHIRLRAGPGQQLHAGESIDTVVYFLPAGRVPAPRPRQADVVTAHRDFRPTAIALPLGSTLRYVNRDTVRHNVFSVTPGAAFNLGYQAAGKSADHVFAKAGLVLVSCNVHHSMEMDVFVVPSRYASRVAADGSFTLHGLPPGPGELVAWNPRARLARQAVALPVSTPVTLPLLAERPRVVTEIAVGGQP